MSTREAVANYSPRRELTLRGSPGWVGVAFFGSLAGLLTLVALSALVHQRWEGYVSLLLGSVFTALAVLSYFARTEMTISAADKAIRFRNRIGLLKGQRFIHFREIEAVRLTLAPSGRATQARIELLCGTENITCPATPIPRQQALFLAVVTGAQLIKISNDPAPSRLHRFI